MGETRHESRFIEELEPLESVEEFLEYFSIDYDRQVVQSKHIPLLRLCRQLLSARKATDRFDDYRSALSTAYSQIALGRLPAINQSACATCQSDCEQVE